MFTLWQVVGGLIWTRRGHVAGYVLGKRIPDIDTYLLPIVAFIVALSLIPVALEVLRSRRRSGEPDSAA